MGMPTHDLAKRVLSTRRRRERGITIYIKAEALEAAGFSPGDPPPFYTCKGFKRSANGRSVIVSLYAEPS